MSPKYNPPTEPPPSYTGPSSPRQNAPQAGPLTPYNHPAYSQQQLAQSPPQQQQNGYYGQPYQGDVQGYYASQNAAYYQQPGQGQGGMYYQQQQGPYYYQQQGPRGYGPGYYGDSRGGGHGGAAEGIMAGCLGALALCCCLDFMF